MLTGAVRVLLSGSSSPGEVADGGRCPIDEVSRLAHRRQPHLLAECLAVGGLDCHGRHLLPRQRALNRERHAKRLAHHARHGAVEARDRQIGQWRRAAGGHGEHRDAGQSQGGGSLHGRPALVPIAIRSQHDRPQIGMPPRRGLERFEEIGSLPRRREGLDVDGEPFLQWLPECLVSQRRHRFLPRHDAVLAGWLVARLGTARDRVEGVHAPRAVHEHGDRRLLTGPLLRHPLRLIEEHGHDRGDHESQQFEQAVARPKAAPPPAGQADGGDRGQEHQRHGERPGRPVKTQPAEECQRIG